MSSPMIKYMGLSSLGRGSAAGNPTVPVSMASFNSDWLKTVASDAEPLSSDEFVFRINQCHQDD